jgi:hypothetical protein
MSNGKGNAAPEEDFEPEYCPGCDGPGRRPAMCMMCGAHFYPYMEDDYDDRDAGEWECCWHCGGAGGFHDCGEDCCPCADPELNETCEECHGEGGWYA